MLWNQISSSEVNPAVLNFCDFSADLYLISLQTRVLPLTLKLHDMLAFLKLMHICILLDLVNTMQMRFGKLCSVQPHVSPRSMMDNERQHLS